MFGSETPGASLVALILHDVMSVFRIHKALLITEVSRAVVLYIRQFADHKRSA